jgi:hypothetical protein
LTIGNKNYSSWSLRPWILMKPSRAYVSAVLEDAHMRDWLQAAHAESWVIEASELGRH